MFKNKVRHKTPASALKILGLIQGVSVDNFGLDQELNHTQALTMFICIIGAERAAIAEETCHPFSNVLA